MSLDDFEVMIDCEQLQNPHQYQLHARVAMATCNSLIELNGQVVGDPLEAVLYNVAAQVSFGSFVDIIQII